MQKINTKQVEKSILLQKLKKKNVIKKHLRYGKYPVLLSSIQQDNTAEINRKAVNENEKVSL